MPARDDDWRLMGQERFLLGATLVHARWRAPRPDWNHDHCEFCGIEFANRRAHDGEGPVQRGYTTTEQHARGAGYHWICDGCFADFAERFRWHVVEESPENA